MQGILKIAAGFTPLQRSLISALSGFVFYGVWAFWVNSPHGVFAGVKAACVQGSYSFSLTLVMTLLVESLYRFWSKMLFTASSVQVATILLTCTIIFSTSWAINAIAGTPEILKTVILGYIVGGIYCIIYVQGLAKGRALYLA